MEKVIFFNWYLNYYFLVSVFKENHVFIEKNNPSEKVDKDGIANLVYLPRLVLVDEECENPNENLRWPLCDKCLTLFRMGGAVFPL